MANFKAELEENKVGMTHLVACIREGGIQIALLEAGLKC